MKKDYSPHSQLPAKNPKEATYPLDYFYENTAKYLVKDTVRIMSNGVSIDLDKVVELEEVLSTKLDEIAISLAKNPIIDKYLNQNHQAQIKLYQQGRQSKMRDPSVYLVPFKYNKIEHRSYFMNEFAVTKNWSLPKDKLPLGVSKWPVVLAKKYAKENFVVQKMLNGELKPGKVVNKKLVETHPIIIKAMHKLAEDQANLYNEKYVKQMKHPNVAYPVFKPGSYKQKRELFEMLGIESEKISEDTGQYSWDREQLEMCLNQVKNMLDI